MDDDTEFAKALQHKERGEHDEAISLLRKLSLGKTDSASPARYELAMLLHALGRHEEGDKEAGILGFKYRLTNNIFTGGKCVKLTTKSADVLSLASVYDGAIPAELIGELKGVFCAGSDFWEKHRYPTDAFFSYNAPLQHTNKHQKQAGKKRKHGTQGGLSQSESPPLPGGALLRRLAVLLDQLARPITGEGAVSYGPTLVTDLRVGSDEGEADGIDTQGWLCPPREGRVLIFDGSLMHGVCPTVDFVKGTPRTTLMVGLWGTGVCTSAASSQAVLGPNMVEVGRDVKGRWSELCNQGTEGGKLEDISSSKVEPTRAMIPVGNCWVRIPPRTQTTVGKKGKGGKGKGGKGKGERESAGTVAADVVDIGRFMIRVEPRDVRALCVGEMPPTARRSDKAVTSISLEELKRLRGE